MAEQDLNRMFPVVPAAEGKRVPGWAIIGIFLILLFYFIADARAFLMPVMLALLLFLVFVPFRRFMDKRGIGATMTAAIVTLGMVMSLVVLGYLVSGPAGQLIKDAPEITRQLEQKFSDLRGSVRPLEEAAAQIDTLSNGTATVPVQGMPPGDGAVPPRIETPAGPAEVKVEVSASTKPSTAENLLSLGPSVAGQAIFTLILLFFLISSGDLLYLKIVQSFDSLRDKRAAYMALREIEDSLGTYLGAITLINAGLGVAIGLVMWAWGMPSPLLFGLAGFLLNFIPYLGSIMGVMASVLVALVMFDGLWTPLLIGASFLALTAIEGQFVTPYFVSRRLQLNTVVVFLTVALWAWLWSVLGMIVAVPVLVVLRVLADHIPGLEKFGNFLAGEDPPALAEDDEAPAAEAPCVTTQLADQILPGSAEAAAGTGASASALETAALAAAEAASDADAAVAEAAEKARAAAEAAGEASRLAQEAGDRT